MVKLHLEQVCKGNTQARHNFTAKCWGSNLQINSVNMYALVKANKRNPEGRLLLILAATSKTHLKLRLFSERLDKQSLKLRWFRVPHGNTANKDKLK